MARVGDRAKRNNRSISAKPTTVRNTIPDVQAELLPPYEFVVVTTKNIPDIPPTTADLIAPAITPAHTAILLLQNGLNIEKPILAALATNPVLSGISLISATEGPHGTIRHNDYDILVVGAFAKPNISTERSQAAAKKSVDIYSYPGVQCTYDADVPRCRWRKLLYNASFNSVAAILGLDTSRMHVSEYIIDELIRPIMFEIQAAARAVARVNLSKA